MSDLTTLPDATSIKTRFPEFESTADSVVMFAIEEAARNVDDSWPEGDRLAAVSILAAHYLAVGGASAGVDGREVVSESIGPISVTYAQVSAATASGGSQFGSTSYGKSYQSMVRRNWGGPISIGGVGPCGAGWNRCGWVPWWPTPRYR
jgi:Protein of unknown function (DUF4054)